MIPLTQNNATNAYNFNSSVNNNNKNNSNLAIPFFDYYHDDDKDKVLWVCVSLIY